MRFFHDTNINFVGRRKTFFFASTIVIAAGIIGSILLGLDLGIDFKGGAEVAVKLPKTMPIADVRTAIQNSDIPDTEIKSFGADDQYLFRSKIESDKEADADVLQSKREKAIEFKENVIDAMNAQFPDFNLAYDGDHILKTDVIDEKIGSELMLRSLAAILLAVLAILIYIAFRFEFVFGLGAVVALVHDVVITFTGIVVLNGLGIVDLEIDQTIVAALLTVLGFSINDTVIIFDRIRENREKYKGRSFVDMVNRSINETLSRTVNTVGTVLLVLMTLVILGGPVLQGFAVTMLVGVITGTYSSIYIASSFVIWFMQKVRKFEVEGVSQKKMMDNKA